MAGGAILARAGDAESRCVRLFPSKKWQTPPGAVLVWQMSQEAGFRWDVTVILRHRAGLSGAVARIALPPGVGRVGEGRAHEAHEAPMAGHAILGRRHMDRRFRNRGDAIKGLPIMTARAIRADARVVHWRVGKGHGVSVTGIAGSRGWKVTGRHALRQGPVVAGNALRWRSLQHAIDVAGHAFDGYVSARQRKDGLGMIETRGYRCASAGTAKKVRSTAQMPLSQASLFMCPLAQCSSGSKLEPNAPRGNNGPVLPIIRVIEICL